MLATMDSDGRLIEKKLTSAETVPHILNIVRRGESDSIVVTRQDSAPSNNVPASTAAPIVNYNFEFVDREKYPLSKKKLEVRKSEKLATAVERFTAGTHVEVISLGYPDTIIRSMVATLDMDNDKESLLASLEQLATSVQASPWLVGDSMTLADIAVAAQLSLLRFPSSAGSALTGKGVPGLSDHPKLQPLFQWRDQIELKLMERTLEEV